MPRLNQNLVRALYKEETGLMDSLIYLIKQVNAIYMDKDVKDNVIALLNKLLDDTVRHSNIISKELMELLK